MYSSLHIRNFRGLRDTKLDDLGQVNLFSGLNNTGKSAVLEAFFLHACGGLAAQFAVTTIRTFRGDQNLTMDRVGDQSPWDQIFSDFDTEHDVVLTAVNDHRNQTVSITIPRGAIAGAGGIKAAADAGLSFSRSAEVRVQSEGHTERFNQTMSVTVTGAPNFGTGQPAPAFNVELKIDRNPAPLCQAVIVGPRIRPPHNEISDKYSNLRRNGRHGTLEDAVRLVEPRLQRVEILTNNGVPTLHLDVGSGQSLPLTVLGDGVTAVINYILAIVEARNGIVVIDEVENGIHHSAMTDLWALLFWVAERNNTQIFATTHSGECVRAAAEALSKRRDVLRLFRLSRPSGQDQRLHVSRFDQDMLDSAHDQKLEVR
jgi:hypothetical protein